MQKTATFDIETDKIINPTVIWCAAVKDHDTGEITTFTPDTIHKLPECLSDYDTLCGHNCIDFDLSILRKLLGFHFKGKVIDTLIMSRVQRPNREGGHSVEAWGRRLGRYKHVYEQWDRFTPEMLERCKEDTEIQFLIYKALLDEGDGEGWDMCHRLNMRLLTYLKLQEEYGWYIDQDHLGKCLHFLNRWIERIDRAITPNLPFVTEIKENKVDGVYGYVRKPFRKDGSHSVICSEWYSDNDGIDCVAGPFSRVRFRQVDLDSNDEVKRFLLDLGWKPNEWNKDKNGNRTSPKLSKDDDFSGIQGSLGRLVARRVQCKQRRGILEGWKSNLRPDGRISTRVTEFATTGRIRHSVVVNVPNPESGAFFAKWMRKCFAATPGWVMIGVDSKGNQIRQLAARMRDEDFKISVLTGSKDDGTDLHSLNQIRAGTDTRTTAKNFFYGLIFGASNKKLRKYGRATREQFLEELPDLKGLIESLEKQWSLTAQRYWNKKWNKWDYKNGYVKGLDGRPILVDSKHKLLNYILMSDEAIQMAAAYVWFHHQMEKRGYELHKDWGMLIWYHDEYQLESKPEISEEAAALAEESIAWSGRFYKIACPHEGEAKIGNNWLETH